MTGNRTSRLRDWRLSHGLKLKEAAGLTGISEAMFSRVERGERELAPLTKVKVARRLGASLQELFDLEPIGDEAA